MTVLLTVLFACGPAIVTGVFDTDAGTQPIDGLPDCPYIQLPDPDDGMISHDHWSWSEIRLFVYGDEQAPYGFAGFFPIVGLTVSGEVNTNDGDGVSVYYNGVTDDIQPYTIVCPVTTP